MRLGRLLFEPEREKVDLELEVKDLAILLVESLSGNKIVPSPGQ